MDAEIQHYLGLGYRLTARDAGTAQLVRPKTFSAFWAIMWFLLCGVGVLVYIFYWMGKRDDVVNLFADEHGQLLVQGSRPMLNGWICEQCGRRNQDARDTCKRCHAPR